MKICVIFTGGTIGSTVKDGWIATDEATKYTLIEKYKAKFGSDIDFIASEPYYLLSENLSSKNLNSLMDSIRNTLDKGCDGIIITHGTDTLHFSAAAAHLAFNNTNIPIVFVSANYPLEDERSNGHANFEAAVSLIKKGIKAGVYISYKNPVGKHYIHSADCALSFSENDDSIYSLSGKPFGVYENDKVQVLNENCAYSSANKTVFSENPKILVINSVPGDAFLYEISGCKAIVLRPYHSGTINTENPSLNAFFEKAKSNNIPVFLVGAPSGVTYETVKKYEKLGIIPLPHTTFSYVYMKLWAGISEGKNLKNLF